MPYASLVPQAVNDPLVRGFLEVAHLVRGENPRLTDNESRCGSHLYHLIAQKAVVMCTFCHILSTMLEDYAMELLKPKTEDRAPLTSYHYQTFERLSGGVGIEFIDHFRQSTKDVDWGAITAKERSNQSAAARNRKRKRCISEETTSDQSV